MGDYNRKALGTYKKPFITKVNQKANKSAKKQASERFKMITQRAQTIREAHPKMKWKNAIKQASKQLYK